MVERVRSKAYRRPDFVPATKVGVTMKAKECAFCGHPYINPCTKETQDKCPNVKLKDKAPKVKPKEKKRR